MVKGKFSERKEAWFRIIVLIVTGIILEILKVLIIILGVVNWLVTVISGKRNKGIAEFCEFWNTEKYRFFRYLTLVSNERPFPFSEMKRISKFK